MTAVSLRLRACGCCRHPQIMTRTDGSFRSVAFPSLVGLVRHPGVGPILFDTGYDPAFFSATASFPERLYRLATPVELEPDQTAAAWVARRGLRPEEIQAVVLSHLHGDHVAGLRNFPNATIYASRAALGAMRLASRFGRVRQGMLAELLPSDFERRAIWFEDRPSKSLSRAYAPFDEGRDLFGDGSLIALELPGHSPGHWGLALRLDDGRDALLPGDAAWSLDAVRKNAPPPRLTTSLLGDTKRYRSTFGRLHALCSSNPELVLVPSHCEAAASEFGLLNDA